MALRRFYSRKKQKLQGAIRRVNFNGLTSSIGAIIFWSNAAAAAAISLRNSSRASRPGAVGSDSVSVELHSPEQMNVVPLRRRTVEPDPGSKTTSTVIRSVLASGDV
jgi:hypothetical protein